MGKRRRRLLVATVALLLLTGILTVVWEVCDWPPPRLIALHGFPAGTLLTGRSFVDPSGIEFVEVAPGETWCRLDKQVFAIPWFEGWKYRLGFLKSFPLAARWEAHAVQVESGDTIWISRQQVSQSLKEVVAAAEPSIRLEDLTCIEPDYLLPAGWTFNGQVEALLGILSSRQDGHFRIPTRKELLYAHAVGALADTRSGTEVVGAGPGCEILRFEDGTLVEPLPPIGFGPTSEALEFRLVWIPPEDAD